MLFRWSGRGSVVGDGGGTVDVTYVWWWWVVWGNDVVGIACGGVNGLFNDIHFVFTLMCPSVFVITFISR